MRKAKAIESFLVSKRMIGRDDVMYIKAVKMSILVLLTGCLWLSGCGDDSKGKNQGVAEDMSGISDASVLEQQTSISEKQLKKAVLDMIPKECKISLEEQDFYRELYKREYGKTDRSSITEKELSDFISGYYAEFYLADYYGIRDSFSYEALKAQWEEENASRQHKKQEGEIFYGPVEYGFLDYFGYLYSNLKLENIEAMVQYADEELLAKGRSYYEENSESYDDLIGATCMLSDGERQEERVFSYDDIQSLYKTNEAVLNFITESEPGDTMQYQNADKTVTIELISREIDHREFDDMRGVIMNDYVQREFYDTFIDKIKAEIHLSMQ